MRNLSCALTKKAVRLRIKTVSRRLGYSWMNLKIGDLVRIVDRCMGFKKGEHPKKLAIVRIVERPRLVKLDRITQADVYREGFSFHRLNFIQFFCEHMHCPRNKMVVRIEWVYLKRGFRDIRR
jgi:hypothetical protein